MGKRDTSVRSLRSAPELRDMWGANPRICGPRILARIYSSKGSRNLRSKTKILRSTVFDMIPECLMKTRDCQLPPGDVGPAVLPLPDTAAVLGQCLLDRSVRNTSVAYIPFPGVMDSQIKVSSAPYILKRAVLHFARELLHSFLFPRRMVEL